MQRYKSLIPLMMFKALLLQSWYRLGDSALEKQLARDLLFDRFIELDLSEAVPDHSTFMNVDEDGFIKAVGFTAGNVHDSQCFTELLDGDESAVYADSTYAGEEHDTWLAKRGVENRLLKRAYRNRPLTEADREFNRTHAGVRSTVERVYGRHK